MSSNHVTNLVIDIPRPEADGTLDETWHEKLLDAMLAGGRIYARTAGIYPEPIVYVNAQVTPGEE